MHAPTLFSVAVIALTPAAFAGTVTENSISLNIGKIQTTFQTTNAHLTSADAKLTCTFESKTDSYDWKYAGKELKTQLVNLTNDGFKSPSQRYQLTVEPAQAVGTYPGYRIKDCEFTVSAYGVGLPADLPGGVSLYRTTTYDLVKRELKKHNEKFEKLSAEEQEAQRAQWLATFWTILQKGVSKLVKKESKLATTISNKISSVQPTLDGMSEAEAKETTLKKPIALDDQKTLEKYLIQLVEDKESEESGELSIYVDEDSCDVTPDKKFLNCDYSYSAEDRWNGEVTIQFRIQNGQLVSQRFVGFEGSF